MQRAETGARRRRGRKGPMPLRGFAASCQGQSNPFTFGRCAQRAPGSRGRRAGGGRAEQGPGLCGALSLGQVLGDSWAWGRRRGAAATRGWDPGGGVGPTRAEMETNSGRFTLICTWLGFSRVEEGCRVEGKESRRAGNLRNPLIPR